MNSLIKKSKNVNGSTNNQKLLNQLQSLIGNHDVMKNMSVDLQKRLQKVLAIAK